MPIPLVDLKAQYESIKGEVHEALGRVLQSGQFVLGEEVAAFEQEFAAYCGATYGVGVNSGTSALHLALIACGVGAGDEVITAPNTFIATCQAIAYTGARPVFVEVDAKAFTLDPARLGAAITPRTKAIIPVHLYGTPADLDPMMAVAQRKGIAVIEDASQAHGALYKTRRVGGIGRVGCFSFYPSKNLGAYGEGGMLVTSDPEIAERAKVFRQYGQSCRYHHDVLGYNYKMDALQAAVLRVKLRHLDDWSEARRRHAHRYSELLRGSGVQTPHEPEYARSVYHLYVVLTKRREAMMQRLTAAGIGFGLHYPIPCHLQRSFSHLGYREGDFPVTEAQARECLSLPMFPELTEEQIYEILKVLTHDSAPLSA